MKTIRQEYQIKAPVEKVWEALTVPAVIEKWGGGPSKMVAEELSEFELWGGDIHGKNIEVVENKKLVQDWYSGDWEKPSRAIFTLIPKDDGTLITLVHENVPDEEEKDIAYGWNRYYLGQIKKLLE